MIQDLDRTLETLLNRELPSDLANQLTISFLPPDDAFPPASVTPPAVDLFLYDVRENRELRSTEWQIERRSDGRATRRQPPVRVDCSYLITAWPGEGVPNPALDEHRILGEVLTVMLRYPTIPPEIYFGSLAGQEPPLPAVSIQPGRLQSPAEFWQSLGGKPKAALDYTVTISVEPRAAVEIGPPVIDVITRIEHDVENR